MQTASGARSRPNLTLRGLQRVVLLAGSLCLVGGLLYVPWRYTAEGQMRYLPGEGRWVGEERYVYSWVFEPPREDVGQVVDLRIDVERLLVVCGAIVVATAAGILLLRDRRGTRKAQ